LGYNLTCGVRIIEMSRTLRSAAVVLFLATLRVFAHHAFTAEYDEKKIVRITGSVTDFKWTNPHAWIYIEGKDEAGRVAAWGFEMGSPNGLVNRGWKRQDLKTGDLITVDGYRAKNGSNVANARTVTLPDGRKLFGGFASTPGAPVR
jgi:hypothetical protein